ncbi:MAG: hypothetical protein IKK70_03865 [Clostridia bacterium]|nr:hypothetical protein [Clostridia bacterium]
MTVFGSILIAMLAALGVALSVLELVRVRRAGNSEFICVSFLDEPSEDVMPDMLIICRTDAEQEEIIRRVCASDGRRAYIKRI